MNASLFFQALKDTILKKTSGKQIGMLLLIVRAVSSPHLQAADASKEVNLQSLLNEMVNRDAVAQWPVPGYTLKEASSHDRRKTDPSNPDTWHSNNDHEQFIRTETNEGRQEWVIMEDRGAGAITRFWTPLAGNKTKQIIRFYFDGATTPSLSVNYLDLLDGKGLVRPPFAFVSWDQKDLRDELRPDYDLEKVHLGKGGDLYLPIPFAKNCKITLDSVPFYYVINYRIYDPGTAVKTFSMDDFTAVAPTIASVSETLLADYDATPGTPELTNEATLAPNQTMKLDLPVGSAAVRNLKVQIDPKDAPQVLRSTILEATFDNEESIWCPLGDFFGAGARLHQVRDWDRAVNSDGTLTALWVMPYQHAAQFSLQNLGSTPIKVKLSAVTKPWKWDDHSMIFHANWRSQHDINTRPRSDWNYIEIHGKGVYVGDTLTAFSPVKPWYGEGDERIYTDGKKFPLMIGTGTEDYYGYAWGMPHYFSSPFLSTPDRDGFQPCSPSAMGDWRGYTTNSRIRLLDGIPFRQELKHDMEIWDWADTRLDYAVGLYWYAMPGATSNREIQPDEARIAIKASPLDPGTVNAPGGH